MPALPLHAEFDSITSLAHALSQRQFSATDLATSALQAIDAAGQPAAFAHVDPALTLEQAKQADQRLAQKEGQPPLAGIPVAYHDRLATRGWRTTAGSRMLGTYESPFNATAVHSLEQAGGVSLGKLACAEFEMDSLSQHSLFAPAANPWNRNHDAGGGTAAAIASGLIMGALGVDTGGTLRQSAAYCGLSALRPTYGLVSRHGLVAGASSMDQAGPIARHARDLLALLDPVSHFDSLDANSLEHCHGAPNQAGHIRQQWERAWQSMQSGGSTPLKGLRIGVVSSDSEGLAQALAQALETALRQLEALGAQRMAISLEHASLSATVYHTLAAGEASSNLARYDGVHFGFRAAGYQDLPDMVGRSRGQGFNEEIIRRIMLGTHLISHGQYEAYYQPAQRLRRQIAHSLQQAFDQHCDVILRPVTPDAAPPGNAPADAARQWQADRYTADASLAGMPALVLPCGFTSQALPIGLQLIGPHCREGKLLALADCFQTVTDWHQRKPELS